MVQDATTGMWRDHRRQDNRPRRRVVAVGRAAGPSYDPAVRPYRTIPLLLLALAAASTVGAARAHAQPAPEPPSVDAAGQERARKLVTEGARLFDEGKLAEAYVAFLAAWSIIETPSIAKNLADCEISLGKHRDAADHLRYITENGEAKPDEVRRAKQQLAETVKKIGTLRVTVTIDGAAVMLDGAPVGESPIRDTFYVTPGKHVVEARKDRYEPARTELEIAAGSSQVYRLSMVVARPLPEEPTAFDRARPWVIRGGVGLAVVGIAVGAGMAALANGDGNTAVGLRKDLGDRPICGASMTPLTTTQMTDCTKLVHTGSQQSTYANVSVGLFVVGGVAALATAGLWTYTVMVKNQTLFQPLLGLRVVPAFDAHQAGAMVVGRW